jgi:ribosomal protein S18 acetylase RimI-like enzyme
MAEPRTAPDGALDIHLVRPEEYEAAGQVTAAAYREFVPQRHGDDWNADDWNGYLELLADVAGRVDRTAVLVAVDEGRIVGCVTLEEDGTVGDDDEEPEPGATHVRMLGVDPAARGKGVGRALMHSVIERARSQGRRFVTLRTTERMTTAQRLYSSLGFERDVDHDMVFDDFRLLAFRMPLDGPSPS